MIHTLAPNAQTDSKRVSVAAVVARKVALCFAVAAVALFGTGLFGEIRFGSALAGLRFVGGERILVVAASGVEPRPDKEPGGVARLDVFNCTGAAIKIVGWTSNCTCTSISQVPVSVPSGGSAVLSATMRPTMRPRRVRVRLWTDNAATPFVLTALTSPTTGQGTAPPVRPDPREPSVARNTMQPTRADK